MSSRLAARLSRFLIRCHPRRWRERYGDELLDVLDQHHAGPRTVLDLAFERPGRAPGPGLAGAGRA